MGRYINHDEVLISMSKSNSNYQNLIFEMFRWLAQKCKQKLCHSMYGSCRTQECPEVMFTSSVMPVVSSFQAGRYLWGMWYSKLHATLLTQHTLAANIEYYRLKGTRFQAPILALRHMAETKKQGENSASSASFEVGY